VDQSLSRRERKKLETRQALSEAALALFREKGYRATTVEEITERADVAKGTFFNYFSSKEMLLDDLAKWHIGQLRAALDVSQGAPTSPVARVKLFMGLIHKDVGRDIHLYRRAFASHLRHVGSDSEQTKREMFGFLTELVDEAQACGEIRDDLDAALIGDLLRMAYFRGVRTSLDAGGSLPPVEGFEHAVDILMDGLAGPNWRRE